MLLVERALLLRPLENFSRKNRRFLKKATDSVTRSRADRLAVGGECMQVTSRERPLWLDVLHFLSIVANINRRRFFSW